LKESQPVTVTVPASQPAPVAAASTSLSTVKDSKSSQAASDIETSLNSLAAQLGGVVGAASENLQTDFLSAFVQLLQTQAVCQPVFMSARMWVSVCAIKISHERLARTISMKLTGDN